jgi:hypothetical protein
MQAGFLIFVLFSALYSKPSVWQIVDYQQMCVKIELYSLSTYLAKTQMILWVRTQTINPVYKQDATE